MIILGIETSCDETAVSVVEVKNGQVRVHTNAVSSQIKKHAPFGGVVPSLAAREHVKNLPAVLKSGLGGFRMADIDLIAVTAGPGLISSLLVGTVFAKALAYKHAKPIIGVNHMEGHIYSNWLSAKTPASPTKRGEPARRAGRQNLKPETTFPALCLIVSGGHTQLVLMKDYGKYKLIGETVDDAAGEAFDKIARILGLGYPGGPAIAKISEKGDRGAFGLPRPMINSKDYNFSFAGLKTSVLYIVRDLLKQREAKKLDSRTTTNLAASTQAAIVDVLIQKTVRAAKQYRAKSIMLSGGVSANQHLRNQLIEAGKNLGVTVFVPDPKYTTDNAAMIALAGYFNYRPGKKSNWRSVKANANWEIV